jgi:hypothetical protein
VRLLCELLLAVMLLRELVEDELLVSSTDKMQRNCPTFKSPEDQN